jgi:O-acetylhomoserine (thiol)-lyase
VLALLEGYGFDGETACCSTSSGMAAIMTAVQPFLMHIRHNVYEPRNFLATAQCYGGTFQQFNVRLQSATSAPLIHDPTTRRGRRRSTRTRFLYGELLAIQQGFFDIMPADLAHAHQLPLIDSTVATPALCVRSAMARTSWCSPRRRP